MMRRLLQSRFATVIIRRSETSFIPKRIDTVPSFIHEHLFETPTPSTAVQDDRLKELKLPKLLGKNLEEHFRSIADKQVAPYRSLLESVERWDELPTRPKEWIRREGWTRYGRNGLDQEQVPYPRESVFIYDVETCVSEGQLPTLAIALTQDSWYSWCSSRVVHPSTTCVPTRPSSGHLIPLGGHDGHRVAIGHNVAYDRVRAAEPYALKPTLLRTWDTMSMSIPIIGMADHQLAMYETNDLNLTERDGWRDAWKQRVSRNSLIAVHEFFYGRTDMDKALQKFFVNESMERIVELFQPLTTYCADDVMATLEIFRKLMPLYREHFPHPVTMAGTMHMADAYLPINRNWRLFFDRSERDVASIKRSAVQAIVDVAKDQLTKHSNKAPDTFMWPEKWALKSKKTTVPIWMVDMFGDATTAMKICSNDYVIEEVFEKIKMKSNTIPRLFGLCYGPYPLHYKKTLGWGFLVPHKESNGRQVLDLRSGGTAEFPSKSIRDLVKEQSLAHGYIPLEGHEKRKDKNMIADCHFYQLPHPNGVGNVGYPIGKDFMADIEQKVIRATRHEELFDAYVQYMKTTTFWSSFRDRYSNELPIWYEDTVDEERGALAPAICPAGTVSRRSVHKLWVTATNANEDSRIGTGLKSMVQAHSGTVFVGADVDSQEQWIAGLYGDASAAERLPVNDRAAGCTPFSNMMLAGSKSDNSDLHSVIAKDMGISRHSAKVLNYARLYGAGEMHSVDELEKQGLNKEIAMQKAAKLFSLTKGDKRTCRALKRSLNTFIEEFIEKNYQNQERTSPFICISGRYFIPAYGTEGSLFTCAFEDWMVEGVSKQTGKSVADLHTRVISSLYEDETMSTTLKLYSGGYESDTFNFLELAATRNEIRTPVLGARLGSSLSPLPPDVPDRSYFSAQYKRSVINWMVQSSAVDFLHLLLACLSHLSTEYDIDARFSISIHDEVRYVVAIEDKDRFALALMLANMYVRAFISQRVGIHQLPMSCAFFSQVDVDSVLRKEVDSHCVNPDGTTVPNGEALNIYDVIKRTDGSLEKKL